MASGFPKRDAEQLLISSHRRCCICHRFCGVKIELDHIEQRADAGNDSIDNAIPVCFECHAEIHSYNDRHPRGRKFTSAELQGHKKQWLNICKQKPEVMLTAIRNADVGPLQSLIDELDFNVQVAELNKSQQHSCLFLLNQFLRAINEGALAMLNDDIKDSVLKAYEAMGHANLLINSTFAKSYGTEPFKASETAAGNAIEAAKPKISKAKDVVMDFLKSEVS